MSYVGSFLTFLPHKLVKRLVLKAIEVYIRCGCAHVAFRSTNSSFPSTMNWLCIIQQEEEEDDDEYFFVWR
jgi:hypothetical protein